MRAFFTIFKFEFFSVLRKKSFIITSIIMSLVVILALSGPNIYNTFFGKNQVLSPKEIEVVIKDTTIDFNKLKEIIPIKKAINSKGENVVTINEDGSLSSKSSNVNIIKKAIISLKEKEYLKSKKVDYKEYNKLKDIKVEITDKSTNKKLALTLVANIYNFTIYFLIIFYGMYVATSVAKEKSTRTMELLISSTSTNSLINAKVFSNATIGILQFSLIIFSSFIGIMLNFNFYKDIINKFDFFSALNLYNIFFMILFLVLGYILYLYVYALSSAFVSKIEDMSSITTPITLLIIASFLLTNFNMYSPNSFVMKLLSYIPFSSPFAMVTRILTTDVNISEVIISIGILILSLTFVSYLSQKGYRAATMYYGNSKNIIKLLFKKGY